jgi:hypothetical protein
MLGELNQIEKKGIQLERDCGPGREGVSACRLWFDLGALWKNEVSSTPQMILCRESENRVNEIVFL